MQLKKRKKEPSINIIMRLFNQQDPLIINVRDETSLEIET
jgi:hypothetical protein